MDEKNNQSPYDTEDLEIFDSFEERRKPILQPSPGKHRHKSQGIPFFLKMLGCLAALAVVMVAGILGYRTLNGGGEEAQEVFGEQGEGEPVPEQTYTQAQMDTLLTEAAMSASQAGAASVLDQIKSSLTAGTSTVETLRPLYPGELVLASSGRYHFVPIRQDLRLNNYVEENLQILENGEYQYLEGDQVISHKGIDVSKHQGEIDWNAVAQDGVEFAFIRVALRGYETGRLVEDEFFEANVTGAISAGIKVGVYVYSQAINEEELLEEANLVLEKIAPYKIECPVVFDVERVSGSAGRMNALTLEERTNLTLLFCQTIENAGYKPMIYHNMEMGVLMLDLETLENYDKWFAYYNQDMYYPYDYQIWQYSDSGQINGISTAVDLNISFAPLW